MRILLLLLGTAILGEAAAPTNAVAITDLGGSSGRPRPFTISRFFARGELHRYAGARVNGTLVETQCDVKTRWPDGSVQHALVSFFAPVDRGGTLTVDFVDQPTGNNEDALSHQQMLALPGWGARIEAMVNGVVRSADARLMLTGGSWRYWLQGRICTQVIVEGARDRPSSAFAHDFGWNWDGERWMQSADPAYSSLHPIFVVTFYRGWSGARMEYILENTWTTKTQNQQYSLTLYRGNPPAVVHSTPELTHLARSRWRMVYWTGEEPAPVNVDHNLPYVIYSRALPSYDLSKMLSPEAVEQEVSAFFESDQGRPGGKGQWQTYFSRVGGRPDIGLFPRWYVRYLYTFDPQLYEVLLGNAAVSGHVPIHYRESLSGRYFDDLRTAEAFGRTLSIDARPTVRTTSQSQDTRPEDAITPVGPVTTGPWTVDLAHQPSFAFIPYLITGDWYFLEELYFWAAYNLARGNPGTTQSYHRHADWGIINNDQEIRGVAWGLRNLAHAALAAPDGSPEKAYFTQKLHNNIAVREGMYNIQDGAFYEECRTSPYRAAAETSKWCWGRNTAAGGRDNPLHFLEEGNPGLTEGLDKSRTYAGTSPWMLNFNHVVLGYLKELGLPLERLQETLAKNLLNQLSNPAYNPYLAASYRIPVLRQPDKVFINSWDGIKDGFLDPYVSAFRETDAKDVEHGYVHIARAAASFLPGLPDRFLSGESAWEWISAHIEYSELLNDNPKWALVPRTEDAVWMTQAARHDLAVRRLRKERRSAYVRQKKVDRTRR